MPSSYTRLKQRSPVTNSIDLLLASGSPRRRELLTQIGVGFRVQVAQVPEQRAASESPADYVRRLALEKAQAVARENPELPVLGADTIGVLGEQVLEKPQNREHAIEMLLAMSGETHRVLTGLAVCQGERFELALCESLVTLRTISPEEAARYWQTGEPQDKAGGYAIQGLGAVFVAHLSGSYSNVVGLPLMETQALLAQFDVPVWAHQAGGDSL